MTLVRRRLIGLAVGAVCLLAVLTAAALWQRHDLLKADSDADEAKLLGWPASDVTGLVLDNANGHFVLERQGTTWTLSEPLQTAADASTVDAIVNAAVDLARTQKVEVDGKPPTDLAMFGLASPRAALTVQRAAGAKTIDIGKRNDFTGDVYARVHDSDSDMMVGRGIEFQVDKTLFDPREKRLIVLDPANMTRIDVTQPDGPPYSIVRENGEPSVRLADGTTFDADATQVSAIESALANLRAMKFVDAPLTTVKTTRARVTLRDGSAHMFVLGEDKDGHWFATLDGEAAPFAEVSGEWVVRKLDVDPMSLRDLRVVRFKRDDVARLTVKRDADAVTMARNEAGTWQLGDDASADGSRVSGLLYNLYGLKASSVLYDHAGDAELMAEGFVTPLLTVDLGGRDASAIATLLVVKDKEGRTVATQQGSGQIVVVDAEQVDDISAKSADYLPNEAQANK